MKVKIFCKVCGSDVGHTTRTHLGMDTRFHVKAAHPEVWKEAQAIEGAVRDFRSKYGRNIIRLF